MRDTNVWTGEPEEADTTPTGRGPHTLARVQRVEGRREAPHNIQRRHTPLDAWYALMTPSLPSAAASFDEHVQVQRARLGSLVLLGFVIFELLMLPVSPQIPSTWAGEAIAMAANLAGAVYLRRGNAAVAGALAVGAFDTALTLVLLNLPGGRLDTMYLPALDLYLVSVLVTASLMPPAFMFLASMVNGFIIVAELLFVPRTVALDQALAFSPYLIYIRPIALQFIVALVAYAWMRSMLDSARRADQAERLATLERISAERSRRLEEDVQTLLAVHVQVANGNFTVRVPPMRDKMLWKVGISLNNLIGRLGRLGEVESKLQRTDAAAQRLAEAIYEVRAIEGVQPLAHVERLCGVACMGTPVDQVLHALWQPMPRHTPIPPDWSASSHTHMEM